MDGLLIRGLQAMLQTTNDKRLLETLNTDKKSDVDMANGNKECVKGKGTCKIRMMNESGHISNAELTDVLFAPQITGTMTFKLHSLIR